MNLRGIVSFPSTALTAGTPYYLFVGAAPANQRVIIEAFGIYGAYNAAGTPGYVELLRCSNAGSSPASTYTPTHANEDQLETFQTIWTYGPTTIPTVTATFDPRFLNPQLGVEAYWMPDHMRDMKGGGFFALRFTPQTSTNYCAWLQFVE